MNWTNSIRGCYLRFAATGAIPAKWHQRSLPPIASRAAKTGMLRLDIVSHCWNYAPLLTLQLSSLVNCPPTRLTVNMTVFHAREDTRTAAVLDYFAAKNVSGVTWNWRQLPREQLFRRAIGRNRAALESNADWIWFTDCDVLFGENCLDVLADELQGRQDALLHPRQERVTPMLATDDPMLRRAAQPQVIDINAAHFVMSGERGRATGPLQIVHGDVARAAGYCNALKFYQQPQPAFAKCYEDSALRWLLGSDGVALDVPGVYRIQHIHKGRYTGSQLSNNIRSAIRRSVAWLKECGHRS